MRITESKLRKIIRESIMKFQMSHPDSPFRRIKVEFPEALAQQVADECADACEAQRDNPRIKASWDYNKYVHPILEKHLQQNPDLNPREFCRAVSIKLEEMCDRFDFRDGANAARKVVINSENKYNAHFADAYAHHSVYGS